VRTKCKAFMARNEPEPEAREVKPDSQLPASCDKRTPTRCGRKVPVKTLSLAIPAFRILEEFLQSVLPQRCERVRAVAARALARRYNQRLAMRHALDLLFENPELRRVD